MPQGTGKRVWTVLPDQLSIRVFFDTGIVEGLADRLDEELTVVFLVRPDEAEEWMPRVPPDAIAHQGADLAAVDGSVRERLMRRADGWLDRQAGYYPLAIRLNHRHGFHLDRMDRGHPNWMLDSAREGVLPRWDTVEHGMARWHLSTYRYVPHRLAETMARECSALVLANVQPHSAVPYLVAARRLAPPRRRVCRELGPHGREGRDLALLPAVSRPERGHARRPPPLPRNPDRTGSWSRAGRRRTSSSASVRDPSTTRCYGGSGSTRRGHSCS